MDFCCLGEDAVEVKQAPADTVRETEHAPSVGVAPPGSVNGPRGTPVGVSTAPHAPQNSRRPPSSPQVEAGRLWAGGVATAIVAALAAVVGTLACRWLLDIPILAPKKDGAYGDVHTTGLVLSAAGAALLATLVLHLLLLAAPRPQLFFQWIIALATVAVMLVPFGTAAPLSQKIATSLVTLVIGLAIGSLLSSVGGRARRPGRRQRGGDTTAWWSGGRGQ